MIPNHDSPMSTHQSRPKANPKSMPSSIHTIPKYRYKNISKHFFMELSTAQIADFINHRKDYNVIRVHYIDWLKFVEAKPERIASAKPPMHDFNYVIMKEPMKQDGVNRWFDRQMVRSSMRRN